MNPDTFDFNIQNYSIDDLENFLDLDHEYDDNNVYTKTNEFVTKISRISDTNFKNKLTMFVNEVKKILTTHNNKNSIIAAGSTFIIDDNKSPTTNFVTQVYSTDITKGNITKLKKKYTVTTFCINSLFRDYNSNSPTDCLFVLPYTIKEVLSMNVISMEIPQSIYLFSNSIQSNTIYFKEYTEDTVTEDLIIFPQGNYATALD